MYRTRQWRRFQQQRIIKRVFEVSRYTNEFMPNPLNTSFRWIDKGEQRYIHTWQDVLALRLSGAKYIANNRTTCSRYCCGNPRKWYKELTIQERRYPINCE